LLGSPGPLNDRISEVRTALAATAGRPPGEIEFRVAASVTQLGLAARLISPALGSALLGAGLEIDMNLARWVPGAGGPFRLSLPRTAYAAAGRPASAGRRGLDPDSAGAGQGCEPLLRLLGGAIRSLVEMTASRSVSRRVLWGNVASAVNGAASMIAVTRPALAGDAAAVSAALLRLPALAGRHAGQPVTSFRRRSCCLIYRVADGSRAEYCGDCVLAGPRPGPGAAAHPAAPGQAG
jgi:FhuF 2Fe-2S C-terminal domain